MAKEILFECFNAWPQGSKSESSEISILYWYHSLAYYTIERMFEKKGIGWVFLGNTSYKSQDLFWDGCFFAEIASTVPWQRFMTILGCLAREMR